MTRIESFTELKKGKKIKHKDFLNYEYLEIVDDVITTEDGFLFWTSILAT